MTGSLKGSGAYGVPQGARVSDTYSAKKWEGVTNVKDNLDLHSTVTSSAPGIVAPTKGGKFQLFIATREPKSTGKQVPSQLVRVKAEYIALLTDPVTNDNDPMIVN
jgi:hypothetical protein